MEPTIITATDDADFCAQGVTCLKNGMTAAIADHGRCILGLSGGSTPKPTYETLGSMKIDWSKVWIFLVDDRYIRADDPNSNQFLLRSTLLKNAPIPESQIIFPDTSLPLSKCIDLYDRQITDLLRRGPPDIVTVGMGDDGHIASLFPPLGDDAFGPKLAIHTTTPSTHSTSSGSPRASRGATNSRSGPALGSEARARGEGPSGPRTAGQAPKFAVKDRISVTLPVLTKARQSVFFLKGPSKKAVWDDMMKSNEDERRWPAKALSVPTVIAQW